MSSSQPFKHQWNIVIRADSNQGAMDAAWACWKAWRDNAQPLSGSVPESMGDRMEYAVRKVDPNHEERPGEDLYALMEVVKLGQELREVALFIGSGGVKAADVLRAHDAREAWDRGVWQTSLKPLTEKRTPKFCLYKTDHGIDGWDAKTKLVARFDTVALAEWWLRDRGYTFKEHGQYAHAEPARRHGMGNISYHIAPDVQVPENPKADL